MNHAWRLEGHISDVLCCAFHHTDELIASGSEDGSFLLHDLRSHEIATRLNINADELSSVAFSPTQSHIIYAAGGPILRCADMRQAGAMIHSRAFNNDEINSVSAAPNGRFLAAADDAGDVKIIDTSTWQLFKSMRGAHDNICSSAVFRPHHPWELLTGSLDASVKRWNFSTGRSLRHWQMQPIDEENGSQAFNPPLVHGLAVACSHWARRLGRLAAVARGDGLVAVYDADLPQALPQHTKRTKKGNRAGPNRHCQENGADEPRRREADGLVCALGANVGGHRSGAGCVTFHKASDGKLLVSGGNDAQVILWQWAHSAVESEWRELCDAGTADTAPAPCVIDNQGMKINCLDSANRSSSNMVIADTSPVLKVYTVQ